MTRDEAKLILQVCRPGDAADDPQLAEALALVKTDAELAAWHTAEQRWDATLRRELQTVPVPVDLKWQILAQEKLRAARAAEVCPPKVTDLPGELVLPATGRRPLFSAWRSPLTWAMAAVFFVVLGLAVNQFRPAPTGPLAEFARDMIAASPMDAHHVELVNANFDQVKGWLTEHHGVADIELPPAIYSAPGLTGCRIVAWHGRQVSMLCFLMEGSHHVDLFVTTAQGLGDTPDPGKPRFAMVGQQMTASWRAGANIYLLTGKVPESFLRHCVGTPASARKMGPALVAAALVN